MFQINSLDNNLSILVMETFKLDIFLFLKTMIFNSAFPFAIKFFSLQIYKKYDFDLQRIFCAKNGPNSLDYKATTVPKPNFYDII